MPEENPFIEKLINYVFAAVLGGILVHAFYQARDNGFLKQWGIDTPVKIEYREDDREIVTAKMFLRYNMEYLKYKVLVASPCFDQVLNVMLSYDEWEDQACYDDYNHLIYFYHNQDRLHKRL